MDTETPSLFKMGPSTEIDRDKQTEQPSPLAHKMRPTQISDYVGQESIMAPGQPLHQLLNKGLLFSMIIWGPPGCGKTSLARLIATVTKAHFQTLNAVTAKISDIQTTIKQAKDYQKCQTRTVLFIDEIHRFTKTQQDTLLPVVESGLITLLGATTENPYFAVIPGLVSRCQIFELHPLDATAMKQLIQRAVQDTAPKRELTEKAQDRLIGYAKGDARKCLNLLEWAISISPNTHIDDTVFDNHPMTQGLTHDTQDHYDLTSAYIKSMRNSDPDAAMYWLGRLLQGGEDPRFVARRLVIFASEDIGNAAPGALSLATATLTATQHIGLPECRINLAQATTYMATAPKSNASYKAINKVQAYIAQHAAPHPVPDTLRDTHYSGSKKMGFGADYKYPHHHKDGVVDQKCWPGTEMFYEPTDRGYEKEIQNRMNKRKALTK